MAVLLPMVGRVAPAFMRALLHEAVGNDVECEESTEGWFENPSYRHITATLFIPTAGLNSCPVEVPEENMISKYREN